MEKVNSRTGENCATKSRIRECVLRRTSPFKVWGCTALALVALLVVADVGRRLVSEATVPVAARSSQEFEPPFRVGELAPDFTLPDRNGKPHRLSELVRHDTLLCFTCGCANCIDFQSFTAIMLQRLGRKAPEVITVTTMPTDREETYFRDTRLKQRLLYERKEGPIMRLYRGHPCPRVYRLAADRTVTWIGSSPGESQQLRRVGLELAMQLGFSPEQALTMKPSPAAP